MIGRATVLAAALSLGGCAFGPQLGQVAVDHNRMVAQSTDELTLLNIVRASHRFPLHFTAITTVDGNVALSSGAEVGIGLDPRVDPQSLALSGGIATNPSFSASVLASENFQRGIQAPIRQELVAYYLAEGWRDSLLMALMIERVDIVGGARNGEPIINDEQATSDFARLLCTYELKPDASPSVTPLVLASLGALLGDSAAASAAEQRAAVGEVLEMLGNDRVQLDGDNLALRSDAATLGVKLHKLETPRCAGVTADERLANAQLIPRFRSTLGVIYFVGEYRREANGYRIPSCDAPCDPVNPVLESRPLIAIKQGKGRALLATEFAGERYFIDAAEFASDSRTEARSMQVLTLIEQLINLQKSAEELPSAINLRTLN